MQLISYGEMFQTVSQYQKFLKRLKQNVTDNYISLVNTHFLIILKVRELQLFVTFLALFTVNDYLVFVLILSVRNC